MFDQQVTLMLSTKFRVNWHFGFQDSGLLGSDQNDFSYFKSTNHLMLSTKFRVNRPFGSGEEAKNTFSN